MTSASLPYSGFKGTRGFDRENRVENASYNRTVLGQEARTGVRGLGTHHNSSI